MKSADAADWVLDFVTLHLVVDGDTCSILQHRDPKPPKLLMSSDGFLQTTLMEPQRPVVRERTLPSAKGTMRSPSDTFTGAPRPKCEGTTR